MTMNRREFVSSTGYAPLGATLAANLPASAQPTTAAVQGAAFDINTAFTGFMRDLGGTPADGGGKLSFTGADPILRSHFRIGTAMALPAMRTNLGEPPIRRAHGPQWWRRQGGHFRCPQRSAGPAA